MTSSAIFYQKIDVFLVLEVPIQRGDVTMIEIELYAQLSRDLVHIFFFSNLLLRHHFHSAQKTCFFVNDKHHFSKLTLTHFLTYRKITLFELFGSLSNILRRWCSFHSLFDNYRLHHLSCLYLWFELLLKVERLSFETLV